MFRRKRPNEDLPKALQFQRVNVISGGIALLLALGAVASITLFTTRQDFRHVSTFEFIGPEKCKGCHEEQAASWQATRMAKTFEVLLPGVKAAEKEMVGLDPDHDYSRDETCLPCHTTGFGQVGGFVSIEETPEMAGVTCEACHGAGGSYVGTVMDADDPTFNASEARSAGLVYPPTATVCAKCHNDDSPFVDIGYVFDFDNKILEGTHEHFQLKYEHDDG